MTAAHPAYLEVIDFFAAGASPEDIINFHPSKAVEQRVADLIARDHENALAEGKKQELADFLQIEHLMIMIKAKARQHFRPRA